MKNLPFFAIVIVSAIALSAAAQNEITVAGRVENVPADGSRTVIINECDVSDRSVRQVAEIGANGEFCERIPFMFGHTFTVNYNRGLYVNAYAEPGDSIFISIDASSPTDFHVSGSHAGLNEQYSHAADAVLRNLWDVKLPSDTTTLSEYMPAFKGEVSRTKAFVDKYVADNHLSPEVARMLYADNLYAIANQAIGYQGQNRDEKKAFFTDSIFDIANEDNTRVMIFPYHLSVIVHNFPEYAMQMPKGLIRDIMLVKMDEDDVTVSRDDFYNTALYDRIHHGEVAPDISAISPGEIIVWQHDSVSVLRAENPIEWLAKEHAGRVVYLDLSATWCGPCRAAIAASEGTRQYFNDTDVTFAIVWLKSDVETWRKLAPTITNAVQIFVPDEDMSNRIMGAFSVQGFPSCYLINRQGDILHEDIPILQSPSLVDFLKAMISE